VSGPDPRAVWDANAAAWIELSRAGFDVYRDEVNTPAFFELLPDVAGLCGLDVGCGEGHNTRLLARRGAQVIAIDVSPTFVAAAAAHEPANPVAISFVLGDARILPFPSQSFDFAAAFMSLMDVGTPETALAEVARILRPGGFFQFSIGHPFTNTPIRRWVESDTGEREALAVGDYFSEGALEQEWTFSAAPEPIRQQVTPFRIVYARRTLASWLNAVIGAGFLIEEIAEPHPDEATAGSVPSVANSAIVPYFLILRARRPR
jgi:ubiquinone/menaquinone biosynthesis C-methylase UbiE